MPNGVHSIQEFRKMIDDTKKEVRDIRSLEAQMRWNMAREEAKQVEGETKEKENEIRDWRWRQSDEMKEYVAEREQATKVEELEESRDYQQFKREYKTVMKDAEQQEITEEYLQDMENASWRADLARMEMERERELVVEKVDGVKELQEIKKQEKITVKMQEEEERQFEQNIEMERMAKELAREREQLLASLQLTRAAQRAPVGTSRTSGGAPSGRQSRRL